MTKQEIEIEIDWDTGKIVAHVEGFPDKIECKKEIMELIDGIVDVVEGGWTLEIIDKGGGPNVTWRTRLFGTRKGKQTN